MRWKQAASATGVWLTHSAADLLSGNATQTMQIDVELHQHP